MNKVLITLALATVLAACQPTAVEPDITPTATATPTQRITTAPTPEPEPTTVPEPEPAVGDYANEDEYIDELLDSNNSISELLSLVGEASTMTAEGRMQGSDFADLMIQAQMTIETHIEFFESRQAPERFAESEALALEAWRLYEQAFRNAEQCGRNDDMEACSRAADLMNAGADLTDQATAALQ